MDWARILAFVTGMADQELLARIEYLAAENRILKAQLRGRLKLWDAERATLGEIGHRLGRKVLGEVANVARPDTILAWYRNLAARKFDGSKARRSPGRPQIKREIEQLIVRMARENRDWGYDRIVGAWANLGICLFGALHETRHQNMALRDRAPESDFRGYFSDTETKLDQGNTAISRHFERGPLWYALEMDWLAEAGGFEPLHLRIEFAKTLRSGREHSNVRISIEVVVPHLIPKESLRP